ncbi:MAG TPA: CHAT domain-containing tetratricopeptide repeat protein [Pyrinomonadaceae bacterium]|jgi:CHAT domain-containing protein|nr:CHAT domain-containing tetratricopeptide repeat protein [Pyrinomonadaceae bacterium]
MKASELNKYFAVTAVLSFVIAVGSLLAPHTTASNFKNVEVPQTDPSTSLSRGRQLLKQGHADQALPLLESALAGFTSSNNARGMAAAQDALGDLYMIQGQYKVALDHYRSAYQSFVVASGKDQTSANVANNVASRAGSTASAATETAATASLDNGFNANLMLAKIGDTNYRMGQMSEASTAYFQMNVRKPESAAAKTTRRLGGLGGIGGILTTGKPSIEAPVTSGIGLLETTKEIEEYRKSIVYMTFELGIGRVAFANKDLEAARKHFQNALDAGSGALPVVARMGQTRRFKAAARTSLGDVALREGRYKDAVKMFNDAADGAKKDERLDLMWPAQRGLGRSLWLQAAQDKDGAKMREQALSAYRDALKTIETIRAGSLRADESRTTFLATTADVYDEAASAFADMALLTAAGNAPLNGKALDYAAESFRIAEAGRARSLLDMLGEVNAQITEGVPADLLKKKQDNLDRQQQIAEQLTGIALSGDQKQKPSDLENELDKLQTEFDQIENQIRTASPRYAALTSTQPLTLADVQQKVLDDNTVLLEYQLGADNSYLFAATKSGVSIYKLPRRADMDKLATDFRAQLIPPKLQRRIVGIDVAADQQRGLGIVQGPSEDLPPFVAASNALYKAAIEPAAAIVGDKRILVVADGALNYIPFEALLKNGDGADYASLNYLVKTNEVVYSPSASVIAAIRQGSSAASGKSMLLVADPVFSGDDPRAKGGAASSSADATRGLGLGLESAVNDVAGDAASSASGGLRLARLSGTRTEADAISAIAKTGGAHADLWTDLNASEDNVKTRDVSSYRYLHVATHGLLDADRPQFTGVVLSLVGNKSNDGFLRTDEIFNLKLGAPMVMLSACETGLGKEKRGEGVIGLTRAFMYAGAPTVGVSLWSVADKSTADLMTDFYKRLLGAAPQSPGAAMRDAQLAMINGKKYSAPFYWAPFVLVGEWK